MVTSPAAASCRSERGRQGRCSSSCGCRGGCVRMAVCGATANAIRHRGGCGRRCVVHRDVPLETVRTFPQRYRNPTVQNLCENGRGDGH